MSLIGSLVNLRYGISKGTVLNAEPDTQPAVHEPNPEGPGDLLPKVRALAASGREAGLDYSAIANSEVYSAFRRYAAELRTLDPMALAGRDRQLAFWINLYNALILDAVVQWRVTRSVQDIPGFFWRAAYNIGGRRYSANDIENGILRGNAHHPAIPGAPLGVADPRRAFSLPHVDPRVHFALVCASRSCPAVGVYDPARIDEQLDQAARSFVRGGGVEMDLVRGRIRISRIFQWYAVDFGAPWMAFGDRRPLLRFIASYLNPTDAKLVLTRREWTVSFMDYDWSLNGLWEGEKTHAP